MIYVPANILAIIYQWSRAYAQARASLDMGYTHCLPRESSRTIGHAHKTVGFGGGHETVRSGVFIQFAF